MTHILERHHPDYWNGKITETQSFFPRDMSVEDVQRAIASVLQQNRAELPSVAPNRYFPLTGTVDGVEYRLGINNGHIGQFYPFYPQGTAT